MSGLLQRLRSWLGANASQPPATPTTPPVSANPVPAPAQAQNQDQDRASTGGATEAMGGAEVPGDLELQYFHWLTARPVVDGAQPTALEAGLLAHLDAVLRSEEMREGLVPRARSIIPQLMHSLREPNQPVQALAARIARDPNLVVEVIRMANTVGYRGDAPTGDLLQAISRLGTEGLRRAIARILLKPIVDARADPLLGAATDRLWLQSEAKANLCLAQAASVRVDAFDAYLAALMQNVGWTGAFRAIDRSTQRAPQTFTAAFVRELQPRRDRLFAQLAKAWALSDALTGLAEEVLAGGMASAPSGLAQLLRVADRVCARQVMQAGNAAHA